MQVLALHSYSILTTAKSLSERIHLLIKDSQLATQDKLNFRSLERRLSSMAEPLSYLLIFKQNQLIARNQLFSSPAKGSKQAELPNKPSLLRMGVSDSVLENNSIDTRAIEMAEEFLENINEFIKKLKKTQV